MLYSETITLIANNLLKSLMSVKELEKTRLVGGTALALRIGHRKSDDLVFFGLFDASIDLSELFENIERVEKTGTSGNMQFFNMNGIKVDFVKYEYPWLKREVVSENIRLALLEDIAALKVNAIIGRGTRKDFIDFDFLLHYFSLKEILGFYTDKYEKKASIQMALRSMVFFEDAENDPMPYMLKDFDWDKAKERIKKEVRLISSC